MKLINWILTFLGIKPPKNSPVDFYRLKCSYCGGTEFFEGPSGGLSVNILCANKACSHWFNWGPGMFFDDLNKVEEWKEMTK